MLSYLSSLLLVACMPFVQICLAAPPFTPSGGLGTNPSSPPEYVALSDFDFQSLNLALNQEWIELDLFHNGLARFSPAEFEAAGITPEDQYLIQQMADQEVGHAMLITNILQGAGAKPCNYTYPFNNVHEFIDFSQRLTRWGEAGVYGFIEHLNSRAAASLLVQSITVEARQQLIFRQLEGLFPTPESFETGLTQSMTWTLLAPYLTSCPHDNPHIKWQNFPALHITNGFTVDNSSTASLSTNRTALSTPGQNITLSWEAPGKTVGYNGKYTTHTTAGAPRFAAWISQLNTTYTPLHNIDKHKFTATTIQPNATIYPGNPAQVINGTVFVVITDSNPFVTPFNLSELNRHVVAGPAIYVAG